MSEDLTEKRIADALERIAKALETVVETSHNGSKLLKKWLAK